MLHLYQSNRVEKLMALLAGVVAVPLASPLAPETIVLQGKGMERWLSLRLAEQLTICANLEFPLPATYVWRLMRAVLGDLPHSSTFSPEILAWRIMGWLGQPDNLRVAPRLRGYLEGGGDFRRYELACRIADIFDQYLVFRPDWVAAWERGEWCDLGPDEGWQAALWRDLAQNEAHWAQLMERLLTRLDASDGAPPLPERVILFGISTLSPLYLELVRKLARHTEVCLFVLNPSREYWELIRDRREQARLAGNADTDELLLETGNPLLASLGKQGRDFCGALADFPERHDVFEQDECGLEPTLLHALQSDILNLVDPEAPGFVPHNILPDDRSLQIHNCHSAMREIEVLHDQLLHLFARDPSLTPDGVAVLAADIGSYAPYIDAVFAPRPEVPGIPYGIAGRGADSEQALVATFLVLLDLPSSRFTADWVSGLLEQPALLRRFDLNEDNLPTIHRWVRETGIRWGRDAAHKFALGLPATKRHTWRDGLSRLMLGAALPQAVAGDGLPLFRETLPYDDVEGERAQVAGRFAEFVETLFEMAEMLKGALPLTEWVMRLNLLTERLFAPNDDDEESALRKVRDRLAALRELAGVARFSQPVGIAVVKSWLTAQLKEVGGGAMLSGGVTFANLAPLRSLPFPVICLLGMNDGDFPRRQIPAGFDLIAKHPRPGDRSRRLDDRYLFLETLLAARKILTISFVGQGIRDNAPLPPSVLVADLLDTVRASCGADVAQRILVKHARQPFSPTYFLNDPDKPGYSPDWLAAARALQKTEGRGQRTEEGAMGSLFSESRPLDAPEEEWKTLELEGLASFYANPARYLMRRRLNIWLNEADADFEVREPFGLDYFARDRVRALSLEIRLHGRPAEDARLLAEAQGWLPHGEFGGVLHAREDAVAEQLAAQLPPSQAVFDPLPLDFTVDGIRLIGRLDKISSAGLVEYTLHGIRPRELFALWLRHLVLCLLKPPDVALHSRLIGADKTVHFAEVDHPGHELGKLLNHYWQGLRSPLPFFVKSSYAYAVECHAGKERHVALKAAHKVWDEPTFRNGDFRGESENAYYRAAYRGQSGDPLNARFEEVALELLETFLTVLK